MRKRKEYIAMIIFIVLFTIQGKAQQTNSEIHIQNDRSTDIVSSRQHESENHKKYRSNEQWYIELQGGGSYTFAENIRNHSFGKGLAPTYAFSVGKNFTTQWGARLQMFGGGDKGRFFDESPFSFNHIGGLAAVTFNITNLIRKTDRGNESDWNLLLMLGPGVTHTYNFETDGSEFHENRLDLSSRNHFLLYGGAELSYRIAEQWDISLEANTSWTRDKYNGLVYKRKYDGLANLMLGIRYTFANK